MLNKGVHIGALIKQKLEDSKMSPLTFANKINCCRTNIYRIFKSKSIDIDQLILISEVLDYDFLSCYYCTEDRNNKENDKLSL
jgi:predicted transcriptional regulator